MTDTIDNLVQRVNDLEKRVDTLVTLLEITNLAVDTSLRDHGGLIAYNVADCYKEPLSHAQRVLVARFRRGTGFTEMFGRDHGPSADPVYP